MCVFKNKKKFYLCILDWLHVQRPFAVAVRAHASVWRIFASPKPWLKSRSRAQHVVQLQSTQSKLRRANASKAQANAAQERHSHALLDHVAKGAR